MVLKCVISLNVKSEINEFQKRLLDSLHIRYAGTFDFTNIVWGVYRCCIIVFPATPLPLINLSLEIHFIHFDYSFRKVFGNFTNISLVVY